MPKHMTSLCAALGAALIVPASAAAQGGEKADPAGGAAIGEVVLATAMAGVVTAIALVIVLGHRSGRVKFVGRAAAYAERMTGVPGWASLPNVFVGGALLIAVIGMYWDISLHIDNGRDPGPLANPAHYLILFGLFGIFVAGLLSMALPERGTKPSATAVRLQQRLVRAAGRRADDRLRGLRAGRLPARRRLAPALRPGRDALGPDPPDADRRRLAGDAGRRDPDRRGRPRGDQDAAASRTRALPVLRRALLAGAFLVGLSTVQAEFDFSVPQFRLLYHPVLLMVAASIALVTARIWIGRGGALMALFGFLVIRGLLTGLVGGVWGQTTPHFPLYAVEAICVEVVALLLTTRRPVAFGAVAGAAIGTFGLAAEWGWSHVWMTMSWPSVAAARGRDLRPARRGLRRRARRRDRPRARPARRGPGADPALGRGRSRASGWSWPSRSRCRSPRGEKVTAQITLTEVAGAAGAARGRRGQAHAARRRRQRRVVQGDRLAGRRLDRRRHARGLPRRVPHRPSRSRSTATGSRRCACTRATRRRPADLPARGSGDPGQGGPRRGLDDPRVRARQEEPPARAEAGRRRAR